MTRLEAEQDVRQVDRRCRGHWLLSESDRNKLRTHFAPLYEGQKWDEAFRFKIALEKALNQPEHVIAKNDWDHLYTRVAGLIFGCKEDCGFDVNDMICAHPFDGVEREVACPKCGTMLSFSVRYDLD